MGLYPHLTLETLNPPALNNTPSLVRMIFMLGHGVEGLIQSQKLILYWTKKDWLFECDFLETCLLERSLCHEAARYKECLHT